MLIGRIAEDAGGDVDALEADTIFCSRILLPSNERRQELCLPFPNDRLSMRVDAVHLRVEKPSIVGAIGNRKEPLKACCRKLDLNADAELFVLPNGALDHHPVKGAIQEDVVVADRLSYALNSILAERNGKTAVSGNDSGLNSFDVGRIGVVHV